MDPLRARRHYTGIEMPDTSIEDVRSFARVLCDQPNSR
jgi:hypothetical protein